MLEEDLGMKTKMLEENLGKETKRQEDQGIETLMKRPK
jgi:hypothetical protein